MIREVRTQEELDAALRGARASDEVQCVGGGEFTVSGSSRVTAYDSSQVAAYNSSQVTAYDSSQVRAYDSSQVTAYDSSQVRAYDSSQVWAYDSSQVRVYDSSQVTAYDSSQVAAYNSSQVAAYNSSQVTAYNSSQVRATPYVAVTRHGTDARVEGGVLIQVPRITNPEAWLEYYGIRPRRGIVTLYKAVDDQYRSRWVRDGMRVAYMPGSMPEAPDFDPAPRDCGAGLHACVSPALARDYYPEATHYVAIPVRVSDLGYPDPDGDLNKIRFRRAAKPVYEVDIHGEPVEARS